VTGPEDQKGGHERDAGRPVAGRPDFRPALAAWDSSWRDPVGLLRCSGSCPGCRTPRLDSSSIVCHGMLLEQRVIGAIAELCSAFVAGITSSVVHRLRAPRWHVLA